MSELNPDQTPPDPNDPRRLPDCGHKDWVLGCERCFLEMRALALQEAQIVSTKAELEGAMLMAWYVASVLANMEDQAAPMMNDLDIRKSGLARDVVANLRQLTNHLMLVLKDPHRLAHALQVGEEMLREFQAALQKRERQREAEDPGAAAGGLIITDGV